MTQLFNRFPTFSLAQHLEVQVTPIWRNYFIFLLSRPKSLFRFLCNIFKKFIYFNWRLITLQYCSVFLPYIDMSQPWMYLCSPSWTPLPPPSPSHPSGPSQCTSPDHPVSCIKPGLAICFTYDNTYVSMLFYQIVPPLPSPMESKKLFYVSVSLLLSRI